MFDKTCLYVLSAAVIVEARATWSPDWNSPRFASEFCRDSCIHFVRENNQDLRKRTLHNTCSFCWYEFRSDLIHGTDPGLHVDFFHFPENLNIHLNRLDDDDHVATHHSNNEHGRLSKASFRVSS
jgi:hypothetical protein